LRSTAERGLAPDSEEPNGALKPWARAAINVSRQLTANANLANVMNPDRD
jgi:hypothetical protein